MDSRLAYVKATSSAESFRREADHLTPLRLTPPRLSLRREPLMTLVLMSPRDGR